MTYYQACCLLVFTILGTAILIDPVTHFVFANPCMVAKRALFAAYYMTMTAPRVVYFLTMNWPMTAMQYYFDLIDQYKQVYPEAFDEDGNLIDQDDN